MALMFSIRKKGLEFGRKFARVAVVVVCCAGFLYQTMAFLQLYWTYPTVVDIQQTSPSYLDVPAFTICNPIGYNYTAFCLNFRKQFCMPDSVIPLARNLRCENFPDACVNGQLPQDFRTIQYSKFLQVVKKLTVKDLNRIRAKLKEYMLCTIDIAGAKKSCNMENVMGSYFTRDELPQFCYTIYSVWGDVHKKRDRIPKGANMMFIFYLNASYREDMSKEFNMWTGTHNLPTSPYVQIAVHSPYFLPSPYLEGFSYKGGMSYEMRITMNEKHLLQRPYQTNCTNYMKTWEENGGRGPINQLNVVQECRMKRWNSTVGCVPVTVDYPHSFDICGAATTSDPNITLLPAEDQCQILGDSYNQPCQSISYSTTKEERDITIFKEIDMRFTYQKEKFRSTIPGYDCGGINVWTPECSTIHIEVLFDRFEITNLTYNAKYESLELFSVLGGYMGMWLGMSLVAIYDFIGSVLGLVRMWSLKKHRKRMLLKKVGNAFFNRRSTLDNNITQII